MPPDSDYNSATHRIWELANAAEAQIQFLGLCKDAAQEPRLRRDLIAMSALVQDGRISTEVKIEFGTNWVEAIRHNFQMNDVIVCLAEQHVGLLHRPLSQILESQLDLPVYLLSGLNLPGRSISNWLSELIAWIGSISIIVGAFILQIQIASMPKDWAQTTLLILSVVAEAWLLMVWNNLFI